MLYKMVVFALVAGIKVIKHFNNLQIFNNKKPFGKSKGFLYRNLKIQYKIDLIS